MPLKNLPIFSFKYRHLLHPRPLSELYANSAETPFLHGRESYTLFLLHSRAFVISQQERLATALLLVLPFFSLLLSSSWHVFSSLCIVRQESGDVPRHSRTISELYSTHAWGRAESLSRFFPGALSTWNASSFRLSRVSNTSRRGEDSNSYAYGCMLTCV